MIQRVEGRGPAPDRDQGRDQGRERIPAGPRRGAGAEMLVVTLIVLAGTILGTLVLLRGLGRLGIADVREVEANSGGVPAEELAAEAARAAAEIRWLAAPERGGRDTPSRGLAEAQLRIARHFEACGLRPLPDTAPRPALSDPALDDPLLLYLRPYAADAVDFGRRLLRDPDPDRCALVVEGRGPLRLLGDFVPFAEPAFEGRAAGELVFAGYAIHSEAHGYDDLAALDLEGKVALVLPGEPSIDGRFGGEEATAEASVWNKLDALADAGAAGALVIAADPAADGGAPPFDYMVGRAGWVPPAFDRVRDGLPALRISRGAARGLLGVDPAELERAVSERGAPLGPAELDRLAPHRVTGRVRFASALRTRRRWLQNVAGWIPGAGGPHALGERDVVLAGAHADHVGVGPRGRIGYGADDNASGVAALCLLAERLGADPPPLDVILVAFSGEEDGLMGSRALAADPPVPLARLRLAVSLDMVGRGPADGLVALHGGPDREAADAVESALMGAIRRGGHGLSSVRLVEDASFFARSDHYAFHEVGVPSAFLFEDWPLREGIYHTWRDTPETVDPRKVARTARFAEALVRETAAAESQ